MNGRERIDERLPLGVRHLLDQFEIRRDGGVAQPEVGQDLVACSVWKSASLSMIGPQATPSGSSKCARRAGRSQGWQESFLTARRVVLVDGSQGEKSALEW